MNDTLRETLRVLVLIAEQHQNNPLVEDWSHTIGDAIRDGKQAIEDLRRPLSNRVQYIHDCLDNLKEPYDDDDSLKAYVLIVRDQVDALARELDYLGGEHKADEIRISELDDTRDDLVGAIFKAEWAGEIQGDPCCPFCGERESGHTSTPGVHAEDCVVRKIREGAL